MRVSLSCAATTRQPQRSMHGPQYRPLVTKASAGAAAGQGRSERRTLAAQAVADQRQQEGTAVNATIEQADDDEEWIEVGRIGPPHGVRGEMKVQAMTDSPEERLAMAGPRWLKAPAPKIGKRQAAAPEEVELEWGRSMISKGNEVWLVKLADIESPEEAALLRGHTLLIPASARPPLDDEDEFYVQDLVGLQVFLQASGEEVGVVTDVFDGTGTHDLLRIQLAHSLQQRLAAAAAADEQSSSRDEDSKEAAAAVADGEAMAEEEIPVVSCHVLLPFAKGMVPVVDLAARRMEVTPPDGLLELAVPSKQRRARRENRGQRERKRTRPRGKSAAVAAVVGGSSASSSSAEE